MDENTHVVYLKRADVWTMVRRLASRAAASKGKATRHYLNSAVAKLDGILAISSDSVVAVYGSCGWLRIIGQTSGTDHAVEIERQLHREYDGGA